MSRLFIVLFLLLSLVACTTGSPRVEAAAEADRSYVKITIIGGETKNGIFDPSIEYDSAGVGWLAYSRVELPKYVTTHIAKSTDHGKSWHYVSAVNGSEHGSYRYLGKRFNGVWRSETSTLLYDPADVPSRRWKLFSHRYPSRPPFTKGHHLYAEGWIEYKYAASPEGRWSKPVRVFGKHKHKCLVDLTQLHPDLTNILWFNEMGSVVVDGVIYLSLDATTTASGLGEWRKRKIILISSSDHGQSWRYTGTLTNYDDANNLGYLVLTGSSLVKHGASLFFLASPSGAKGIFKKNRGHDGTVVIKIEDITRAKLERDKRGELIVRQRLKPVKGSGGLSDYDENNINGGVLFSQLHVDSRSKNTDFFQIFSTKKQLLTSGK